MKVRNDRSKKFYLVPAVLLAASQGCFAASNCGDPDEAIATHLASVRERDMRGIEATITKGDRLVLILPDGTRTDSRQEYIDFHKSFFNDKDWSMTFDEIARISTERLVMVSLRSTFRPAAVADGRSSWLSMGFGCETGDWRLVFDQNTRLPVPRTTP